MKQISLTITSLIFFLIVSSSVQGQSPSLSESSLSLMIGGKKEIVVSIPDKARILSVPKLEFDYDAFQIQQTSSTGQRITLTITALKALSRRNVEISLSLKDKTSEVETLGTISLMLEILDPAKTSFTYDKAVSLVENGESLKIRMSVDGKVVARERVDFDGYDNLQKPNYSNGIITITPSAKAIVNITVLVDTIPVGEPIEVNIAEGVGQIEVKEINLIQGEAKPVLNYLTIFGTSRNKLLSARYTCSVDRPQIANVDAFDNCSTITAGKSSGGATLTIKSGSKTESLTVRVAQKSATLRLTNRRDSKLELSYPTKDLTLKAVVYDAANKALEDQPKNLSWVILEGSDNVTLNPNLQTGEAVISASQAVLENKTVKIRACIPENIIFVSPAPEQSPQSSLKPKKPSKTDPSTEAGKASESAIDTRATVNPSSNAVASGSANEKPTTTDPAAGSSTKISDDSLPPTGCAEISAIVRKPLEFRGFRPLKIRLDMLDNQTAKDLFGSKAVDEYFIAKVRLFNVIGKGDDDFGNSILVYSESLEVKVAVEWRQKEKGFLAPVWETDRFGKAKKDASENNIQKTENGKLVFVDTRQWNTLDEPTAESWFPNLPMTKDPLATDSIYKNCTIIKQRNMFVPYRPLTFEMVLNTQERRDSRSTRNRILRTMHSLASATSFITSVAVPGAGSDLPLGLEKFRNLLIPSYEKLFPSLNEVQRQNITSMVMRPLEEIPFGSDVTRILFFPKRTITGVLTNQRNAKNTELRISAISISDACAEAGIIKKATDPDTALEPDR